MKRNACFLFVVISVFILISCENREVNENEGPNFSEIHEEITYHFDSVLIDGIEYHILERDRNNPHEGFGFMALDGVVFKENQDSIKAYLKTMMTLQVQILSRLNNASIDATENRANSLYRQNLNNIKKDR